MRTGIAFCLKIFHNNDIDNMFWTISWGGFHTTNRYNRNGSYMKATNCHWIGKMASERWIIPDVIWQVDSWSIHLGNVNWGNQHVQHDLGTLSLHVHLEVTLTHSPAHTQCCLISVTLSVLSLHFALTFPPKVSVLRVWNMFLLYHSYNSTLNTYFIRDDTQQYRQETHKETIFCWCHEHMKCLIINLMMSWFPKSKIKSVILGNPNWINQFYFTTTYLYEVDSRVFTCQSDKWILLPEQYNHYVIIKTQTADTSSLWYYW